MSPLTVFLITVVTAVAAKAGAWAFQLRTRNAAVVDAVWALALGSIAVEYAVLGSAPAEVRLALGAMGGLWGLRLGMHLWRRNAGRPEDFRYARFRQRWGAQANRNLFWFFQFQNVFTLALSAAAFMPVAFRADAPSNVAIAIAVMVWLAAVLGEDAADRQMETFRANPMNRGRVCREGLWRYSRHPNYFFECLHWLAYVPLALGAAWGWASFVAPLVMAALLMKLSGVPLLEEEMAKRKPGYADYMRTTSMLIPWPPRGAVR
jgi:steroid 5-alpha reductase family enzyme